MVGAGAHVFALMAYIISHMQPDKEREEHVKLNPDVLGPIIGESTQRMQDAIDYLCAPDPKTSTPGNEGRRLVKVVPYLYWVVNGKYYREIINEADRRAKAAHRQAKHRELHPKPKKPRTPAQVKAAYDRGLRVYENETANGAREVEAHNASVVAAAEGLE